MKLLVKLYGRRSRGYSLALAGPFPETPVKAPRTLINIVTQASLFQVYLNKDPGRTHVNVSQHFGVSRDRVAQLISVVNRLPEKLTDFLRDCDDPAILKIFTGRALIQLAKLPTVEAKRIETDRLLSTVRHKEKLNKG